MASFCSKCGKELIDNEKKCQNCGTEIKKETKLNKKVIISLIVIILIAIIGIATGFFTSGSFTAKGAIKKWAKAILNGDETSMTNITDVVALEAIRVSATEEDFDGNYKALEKVLKEICEEKGTTAKEYLKEGYANAFSYMSCYEFDINYIGDAKKVKGTKNLYRVNLNANVEFGRKTTERKTETINCQVYLIKKNCKYYVAGILDENEILSYYEPSYSVENSTTEPSQYEIDTFNSQFENYGGDSVTGATVKSLISAVETSNRVNSDKEVKLSGTTTSISQVRNTVKYNVEFKYKDKYISEVIINRK